jgi:hypothetical protein
LTSVWDDEQAGIRPSISASVCCLWHSGWQTLQRNYTCRPSNLPQFCRWNVLCNRSITVIQQTLGQGMSQVSTRLQKQIRRVNVNKYFSDETISELRSGCTWLLVKCWSIIQTLVRKVMPRTRCRVWKDLQKVKNWVASLFKGPRKHF